MPYRPTTYGPVTDGANAREVAAQRPALATRIHREANDYDGSGSDHSEFEDSFSSSRTIRGDRSNDECERMNEALNAGRGIGRSGRGRS